MAKKIGIRFENIKGMAEYEEDAPSSVESIEDGKIGKDLITKIQGAGHQVVVYAESGGMKGDSDQPDFQRAFVKSIIQNKLDEKEIPYDLVEYDDSGLDINLNYEITRYKNWQDVLINVLKSTK